MNENMKKWIAALRSGNYAQCQQALRIDDSFCCLGVATDLYLQEQGGLWEKDGERADGGMAYVAYSWDGQRMENMLLPEEVADWLGLGYRADRENPIISFLRTNPDGETKTAIEALSDLNDVVEMTFGEIADLIEAHLLPEVPA